MRSTLASIVMTAWLLTACTQSATTRAPEPRTTRGDLAINNLVVGIEARREMFQKSHDPAAAADLVGHLLTRSRLLGTYLTDFTEAVALANDVMTRAPGVASSYILRARVRGAIHDFAGARDDLQKAAELGADVGVDRALLSVAAGDQLVAAQAEYRDVIATTGRRSFATLSAGFAIEAALGEFALADSLSAEAVATHLKHDVSPLPVAMALFSRGVMWAEEAAQPQRARPLYEEAVVRLPKYVVANVHLSELEWHAGEAKKAIARLEALVQDTDDGEVPQRLAEYLAATDRKRSDAYLALAKSRYERLLAAYPQAFWDHAAEFYSGIGGDPKRGLELALKNLELRPSMRAYIVAIRAARAAGDSGLASKLGSEGMQRPGKNQNLIDLVAEARL